jgi:PAS domain S-box-containing protein
MCVVVVFAMVFRPMLAELTHEEEGTKLMLKMIPEEVRQSVPAIAEYLRRGVILQDTKVQSINDAMADMSTLPTIAIDFQGTILRFSRAAEETFGYSRDEVVGKNVKVLMPSAIAIEHDSYLDNYYRTGVKRVIGRSRRVRGQRKDGTVFPVEINVKEIKTGASTTFVGTLRDVAVDVEFERTTALSKAVSEVAPLPIIVINDVGIVLRFNTAAEKLFDYSENEIVGHNVSRLMTDADASKHDSYLERYKSTGVPRVVGKMRAVKCRRRTGGVFIGLLSVVELRQDNGRVFIAYCSDCTEKIETDVAVTLGDAIAITSPVPLVAIDPQGIVESWNPAAARVFRTPASEIMGRNIKQIMPEAVAAKHDMYLTSYLRTGKKTMLDKTTSVKARRPAANSTSFEQFPATVSTMEVFKAGGAKQYVAYIRDESRVSEIALNSRVARSIRQLSIIPIILIDPEGTVKAFAPAAETLFQFSADEVVGQNIKMLMPKEIADQHDGFLQRYRDTGVKHVINTTRRVNGMRKDGTEVPLELSIRETQYAGEVTYVGFVRSVEIEVEQLQQNSINDAVARLSTLPVIAIDMSGSILSCSESACVTFDWPREELIGQNIKVLMPDGFANEHDEYLAKYARRLEDAGAERARATSGIINRNRRVTAKRRDEVTFPAEVSVRDLHIDGLPTVFVGTIRDISDDLEKAAQTRCAETIIETSSVPFIAIDRLGTISVFSKSAEEEWGYSKAEVMGKNIKMLMPEEVAVHHDGYLRAYAKTGVKTIIDSFRQVTARAKDGSFFPVEINVREVTHTDATGKSVSEYVAFARSLKQERILQQAAEINRVTADLVSTPVVMIDELGKILDFNPPAQQVFGYTAAEAVGQNIKILQPASVAAKHDEYLATYKRTGVKHVIDTTRVLKAVKKGGVEFPAELSIREVIIPGRDAKQFVGYVRDLTEIQRVEERARVNAAIIDVAPTALIVMDRIGTVSVFSRAAQQTFGFEPHEVIGQNVKMLMPEEVASQHDFFLARYAKDGIKRVVDTTRHVTGMRKNGARFNARITVVEIEVNGETNYVGYVADDTERLRTEDEMNMADFFAKTSTVPIISMDHIGTIISYSPAAEALFGYTAAEVVNNNIKMLQPERIAKEHDRYLSRYMETGNRHVIGTTREVPARRKDGSEVPVRIRVTELRPDPKQPPTFISYVWSIEEELRIANASIESATLLAESPAPIVVITQHGIITQVNAATLQAWGYATPQELIGQNVKILTPDEIAAKHDGFLQRYRETGEAHVIGTSRRVPAKRKDGSEFPVQLYLREVKVDGLDTQYIGALRVLEEEERVRGATEVSAAIAELSTNGQILMTPEGKVTRFSKSAERITGFKADEVVGQNIKMLMPPHIAEKHDGYLQRYKDTGVRHVVGSVRKVQGMHKSGRVYPAQIGVEDVALTSGHIYAGFLENMEGGANVAMSAEVNGVMQELSVHCIIMMSEMGSVLEINRAGIALFGLDSADEVVGQNIKMLMPESTAVQHDGYLAKYRETGVKAVVDSTRRAKAKNVRTGKDIPIEISVRELPAIGDTPRRFLGYVRDITDELRIDVSRRTGEAMMDLSKYAVVVIDSIGTIIKFSRAAEVLWGCGQEIVNQNVKMLMPESVAQFHDGYLEAYRRTGKKTVIDRSKDVMAVKVSNGAQFMVTLQVKELKFDAKGLENVYVAFVEEQSASAPRKPLVQGQRRKK